MTSKHQIGVLLVNTGTPDAPTPAAIRKYLREFLSDKRVIRLPRLLWYPILYGFILPFRPRRLTKLYKKIWSSAGSPLRANMQTLASKLTSALNENNSQYQYVVTIGMNYGNPSIASALQHLQSQHINKLVVLPLYPQFSTSTTSSTFDRVGKMHHQPITHYAAHPTYITALADSIRDSWIKHGRSEHLLISFHGLPQRYIDSGDPYQSQCEQTAHALATVLQLNPQDWTLCYQSRFGAGKWLAPSTQQLFMDLPKRGIKSIDVITPGFAIDCLETLEEIAHTGKEDFIKHGGEKLQYIPALNASPTHAKLLAELIDEVLLNK